MQQSLVQGPSIWSTAMAKPLLSDALWERIGPLLPPPPKPQRPDRPGRHRRDDRRCRIGILFVLKTGIDWEDLPVEMGCGSGRTCGRRLAYWTQAGVWPQLQELLVAELNYAGRINWQRAVIDSWFVRARRGRADRPQPGRPTEEGQQAGRGHRRRGHPTGGHGHGGPRPGRPRVGADRRGDPAGAGPAWPPPPPAGRVVRRPGFRLRPPPSAAAAAGHPPADRPPPDAARQRLGPSPLGRGADVVVAPQPRPPEGEEGS